MDTLIANESTVKFARRTNRDQDAHWDAEQGLRGKDQLMNQVTALALVYVAVFSLIVIALP